MKHVLLAAAAALVLSAPAYAGIIGDTNNYDITNNTPVANAGAQAGAAAGAVAGATGGNATGGSVGDIDVRGGAGGSATSTLGSLNKFGGDGGSVLGSGNSSNTNLLGQGQMQGQIASSDQSQSQSQHTNQANAQTNSQNVGGQTATNSTNVDASDRSVTTYQAATNPVNTAYAAPLSVGGGVCVYTAASAGGSGVTLSLSGSVAKRDAECDRRAFADMMARLGDVRAARELLKQNESVRDAYALAGTGGDTVVIGGVQPSSNGGNAVTSVEEPKAFSFTPMQPIPNPKTPRGE